MSMNFDFNASEHYAVSVNLNAESGLCDVTVKSRHDYSRFTQSLSLMKYNDLIDFLSVNDHQYAIHDAEKRFAH